VVAGASDTGKSYILQCVDFMLGGKNPPEPIQEAQEYEDAWIELRSRNNGTVYSLRRSLKGGAFALYEQAIESVSPNLSPSVLAAEHSETDEGNISSFLLSLSGFSPAKILKKHRPAQVQNLTFRTIVHLVLIGEDKIIGKKSPVWMESGYQKTASESAFNLLLTGNDDSSLVLAPDPDVVKGKLVARAEVLDEMISALEGEVASAASSPRELRAAIEGAEQRIAQLGETISASSEALKQYQQQREAAWAAKHEVDSRLIVIAELLKRFDLLKEHYRSDLSRLEFISEGQNVFDQLETIICPLCGNSLEEHVARKMCMNLAEGDAAITSIGIEEGCRIEGEKIRRHIEDLGGTVASLQAERAAATDRSAQLTKMIASLDQQIASQLQPIALTSKAELDQLVAQRELLQRSESLLTRLAQLREARDEVEQQITDAGSASVNADAGIDTNAVGQFCNEVRSFLVQWHYSDSPQVHFDQRSKWMDLVIDGQPRKSHGKGIRALTHSAFNLGLMRHCQSRDLPHPMCVILDSPLLSLRERKEGEVISEEVQEAFYRALAECSTDEQVIVLENKEPPPDVKAKINYVEFSGSNTVGRKGFFPT
jgi:predicted  nucleic acid-binding Zn-ribbon protein